MKTLRKMLKLLPPAFAMRIWLGKRYGIKVRPAPWRGLAGLALEVLPYAFTAALSVREDSDARLLKYFLPYGRMKNFVRLAYGMQKGNGALDHGAIGAFRSVMPYGLVLWWDAEDAHKAGKKEPGKSQAKKAPPRAAAAFAPDGRISEGERQELQRMDRIEATTLRLLIVEAARLRRVSAGPAACPATPAKDGFAIATDRENA